MLKKIALPLMGAALLLLTACGSASETPTSEAPAAAPASAVTETPSGTAGSPLTATRGVLVSPLGAPDMNATKSATLIREAQVETVTVQILESAPVQVQAIVTGILGDGCTELLDTTQRREDSTFYITLRTQRPADAMCTQIARSYEQTVTLDLTDTVTGDYIVSANGVTTTFKLP